MRIRLTLFIVVSFALAALSLHWDARRGTGESPEITPASAKFPMQEKLAASDSDPRSDEKPLSAQRENESLRQRLSELDQENEKLKGQLTDLLNWILVNVRGRYPVREQDLSHLKLPVVNEEFQLDNSLADFLKLSTDEIFLVEDAFEFTRARLRVLQDANMELIQDTPNQIVMNIQSFPEAGSLLQNELDLALKASLGPDRLERLKTVSDDTLKQTFDYFGQASRSLIFELLDDPSGGPPRLIINDGWFNEQNPEQLVYTESEITVETLPEKYRDFEIYLTENFAPVSGP